jgi:CheY-like chemotaxis protein
VASSSARSTILIVDDDDDRRAILGAAFEQLGAVVVLTSSATMALEIAGRITPDAVVTDLHLSRGPHDGRWLLHEIRQLGGQQILVFALSGEMTQHNRETLQAAGFDGFFPKPFDPLEVAGEVLGRVREASR